MTNGIWNMENEKTEQHWPNCLFGQPAAVRRYCLAGDVARFVRTAATTPLVRFRRSQPRAASVLGQQSACPLPGKLRAPHPRFRNASNPDRTALTRIPRPAYSCAAVLVSAMTPWLLTA